MPDDYLSAEEGSDIDRVRPATATATTNPSAPVVIDLDAAEQQQRQQQEQREAKRKQRRLVDQGPVVIGPCLAFDAVGVSACRYIYLYFVV